MTLPPLPEPDTHCFDDDVGKDVWSHSPEQLRAYGEVCAAAERERLTTDCAGLRLALNRAESRIQELLVTTQGEPVAWFYRSISGAQFVHFYKNTPRFLADQDAAEQWPDAHSFTALYIHPPQQRKPLTKVQITELAEQCGYDGAVPTVRLAFQGFKLDDFARAIERAHSIVEAP